MQPRTAAAEHIVNFKEMDKSRNIKPVKAILHPGEVGLAQTSLSANADWTMMAGPAGRLVMLRVLCCQPRPWMTACDPHILPTCKGLGTPNPRVPTQAVMAGRMLGLPCLTWGVLRQVNKIRDLGTAEHKHMVVTHTDAKETYVWNMDTQASHHRGPKVPACPAAESSHILLSHP